MVKTRQGQDIIVKQELKQDKDKEVKEYSPKINHDIVVKDIGIQDIDIQDICEDNKALALHCIPARIVREES